MRLVLIPGLGADERLFDAQRKAFPELHVPAWIAPESASRVIAFMG